jgi:hypothetical protein
MHSDIALRVAHLDGYLSGLAAQDGDIRQYTAGAFVVAGNGSSVTPETLVRDFYAAQTDMQFSSSQKLEHGLADLDHQLRAYVIQSPWGLVGQTNSQQLVDDRRRYLTFRVMDMIDGLAPEAYGLRTVYKLESKGDDTRSQLTFFCIKVDGGFLVLQFNDDSPFIRAQEQNATGGASAP